MAGEIKDAILWCRVEEEGGRVNRVHVMHPNGEILLSYPPEHFEAGLVRRMRAGQVRARLLPEGKATTLLRIEDESGGLLHSERADPAATTVPRDSAER
jgi:hypothetical protein